MGSCQHKVLVADIADGTEAEEETKCWLQCVGKVLCGILGSSRKS